MHILKTALLCSIICTATPSHATFVYIHPNAVEILASKISLSTAKVILATTIACITGGILGAEEKTIQINDALNQLDPELDEVVERNFSKRNLAIIGATALGSIGLIALVNEDSHPIAQWLVKTVGASTVLSASTMGLVLAIHSMGFKIL